MTSVFDLDEPGEIAAHYLQDARPAHPDRPWITLGMISSLDGSATADGGSTALGGPPDRAAFRALRASADVVVVGASTARSELYRSLRVPDDLVAWRRRQGMSDAPRLAVVTASLDLAPTVGDPIILTCEAAPAGERSAWERRTDVVVTGDDRVDLVSAMATLRTRFGAERVILEGGPTLNGQMAHQVDEVSITIAPVLVGGSGPRIVRGPEQFRPVGLDRVIHCRGFLLLRYLTSLAPCS